jgi:hypothetical protein
MPSWANFQSLFAWTNETISAACPICFSFVYASFVKVSELMKHDRLKKHDRCFLKERNVKAMLSGLIVNVIGEQANQTGP